jgi:hypothetical protein
MGGYFATQADWASSGRKCAQSEASEKISGAPPLPRAEGLKGGGNSEGGELPPSEGRTEVLQALGMIRGYCAMKTEEKIEGGGKKSVSAQPGGPNGGARLRR